MRFHNAPKRNLQDKNRYESSVEIKPNWKRAGLIVLAAIGLFGFIASAQYLLQAQRAHAAGLMYRDLIREWPREGSLVYVPFGIDDSCLHLARFDPDTGSFYDNHGWLNTNKFLYVSDRWPDDISTCTSEDLENAPRFP